GGAGPPGRRPPRPRPSPGATASLDFGLPRAPIRLTDRRSRLVSEGRLAPPLPAEALLSLRAPPSGWTPDEDRLPAARGACCASGLTSGTKDERRHCCRRVPSGRGGA